ncbi:MAG: 1-acyl-sn-glycerol-3-phosphate acyltransferase [Angelakisella sp.]|jgi:1-acyl-sn-glycerol-3-phosphate acyltransferase|nr:1-acyl-sn-glycerol-3-phosphate acyltransferase [Angelakisella sp.]
MRTIVWFLYFWGYLLFALPQMKKAQRLEAAGELDARDALVEPRIRSWARSLLKLAGVKVEISGLENIPEGPVVFVPNHQSYFDIPVLLAWLDRPYPLVSKQEVKKLPLIRQWMELLGCVFIDRDNARQSVSALGEAARTMVERKRSLIIFPEGTRSRGETIGEFKNGGFRAALKAGVPVVPVVIDGTYRAMEANHMWIKPAAVKVQVLEAIPTAGMSREESKEIGERVRGLIAEAKQ